MRFPSSLPHHVSTVNQSQGGQASGGGLLAQCPGPAGTQAASCLACPTLPYSLPVLGLQLARRTLSSILHLPHPSHRPLGVSVTPRAVTSQHLPT